MSYESRVFIVNRNEIEHGNEKFYVYAEQIADIKMGNMYDGFTDLFDKKVGYELYVDSGDETTQTDKYGETMRYTNCKTVIAYLENLIADGKSYRRLTMLLGLLKGINEEEWNDIQIVHYGY